MSSKELIEKVARVICFETGSMGDPMPIELQRVDRDWQEHTTAAKAAISTILSALQEPTEAMFHDAEGLCVDGPYLGMKDAELVWGRMLNASALGEKAG